MMMKAGSTPLSRATRRSSVWAALRCSGTALPTNLLLMVKLIALSLLLTNHVRLIPDPFLPFLPVFDRIGELSLATIVAHILNRVIRPVTAWWHPQVGQLDDEQSAKLRKTLAELSMLTTEYAKVLAQACGAKEFVRYLIDDGMRYRRPASDG